MQGQLKRSPVESHFRVGPRENVGQGRPQVLPSTADPVLRRGPRKTRHLNRPKMPTRLTHRFLLRRLLLKAKFQDKYVIE